MNRRRKVDHKDPSVDKQDVRPPLQVEVYPSALVELFDDTLELVNDARPDLTPNNIPEVLALKVLDGN